MTYWSTWPLLLLWRPSVSVILIKFLFFLHNISLCKIFVFLPRTSYQVCLSGGLVTRYDTVFVVAITWFKAIRLAVYFRYGDFVIQQICNIIPTYYIKMCCYLYLFSFYKWMLKKRICIGDTSVLTNIVLMKHVLQYTS